MRMRLLPGAFFILLLIAASTVTIRQPLVEGRSDILPVGRSTYAQAGKESALPDRREASQTKIAAAYGKLPLSFEANRGQADAQVQFISRGSGYTLYMTSTEAVLTPRRSLASGEPTAKPGNPQVFSKHKGIGGTQEVKLEDIEHHAQGAVRMKLVGANLAAGIEGLDPLPGKSNYFIGNDPAKWRTNIPTYAKVRYKDLYPGVDLVYYGNQQQLEYDFIVAPGVDPTRIRLAITGAKKLDTDADGDVVLRTDDGEVRLRKPVVYQQVAGVQKEIAGRYALYGDTQVGFEVPTYDSTKPLIIDPVLSYSTYLGGSGGDAGLAIAVDSAGNAYVTGSTTSPNFPTKNPLQAAFGGSGDAFVSKLDPTGSTLIYSTYLGGSGYDAGSAIAVDASGNAYVTGITYSPNFPTKNPFQAALGSPFNPDAFVAKLDPTGSALLYSTYLGGSAQDSANAIAVDASGNVYVTGSTGSTNFPTKNPFQAALGGGGNAFVAKFDPTGSTLVYSTYLGGTGTDQGRGMAVDASGNAYVTGSTSSANFPTKNPLQLVFGGSIDAFVAKLDPSGSALVYSTYLGGSGFDFGNGIAVDSAGNAYVTGSTTSPNFPTASPFQVACGACSSAGSNAFVSKLNPAGSALVYSTYLGGSGSGSFSGDFGSGIAVDSSNNAYIAGVTSSPNFPLSSPIQSSLVLQTCFDCYGSFPCANTAFVTKFNAAGSAPVYSTFLGASGGNLESGRGIAVDSAGNAYATGTTPGNLPLTAAAFQPVHGGGYSNAFVAKISPSDAVGFSLTSFDLSFPDEGIGGTTAAKQVTLTNSGSAALTTTSIVPSGGDFPETNTCGSSLAGGTSCSISVKFGPTAAGARSGTIVITDNAGSSPQTITLRGMGIAGLASTLSPTSLSFGSQALTTRSPQQAVTLTNTGSASLTINGFPISGANPSDFFVSSSLGNCSLVAVSASCTINIVFGPQAVGNRSATLQVLDNSAQSPRTIALSGVGTPAPPDFSISPTTAPFATVTAGQSATYTVSAVGTGGFSGTLSVTCAHSIPGANCSVSPNSLTVDATPRSSTVTVTTTARSAVPPRWRPPILSPNLRVVLPWLLVLLSLVILIRALRQRSRRRRAWVGLAAMLMATALFFGCGGGSSSQTPAGTYQITVSATSAGVSHTTPLSLTVR